MSNRAEIVAEAKRTLERKGNETFGYVAIVETHEYYTLLESDGVYRDKHDIKVEYLIPPMSQNELARNVSASWAVYYGWVFETEEDCRKAAEKKLEMTNKVIDEYNMNRAKRGEEPFEHVALEDYLLEVCKVKFVQKLEIV